MTHHIAFLADHPEYLDQVAFWQWDEWDRDMLGLSLEEVTTLVRECSLHKDRLDINFIALTDAGECVGTIELADNEFLPGYEGRSPFLGSLYVAPEWRGKGIARQLMRAAMHHAVTLGFPRVYLYTHTVPEAFIHEHGFTLCDTVSFDGHEWRVYDRVLSSSRDMPHANTEPS